MTAAATREHRRPGARDAALGCAAGRPARSGDRSPSAPTIARSSASIGAHADGSTLPHRANRSSFFCE
ncbi:hypothetical protein WT08_22420 [Burkholderia sp. MSMB1552]|nr:hypothetical protein AQ610_10405 [Burkholderia humptydooensis]KST74529.1 hypothetical protein WS76_10405 [Burkholderia humptydooensis]KVN03335.1 hypothetical protein WT08_22420 [Burkholderia sp. MSMB1552]KWZ55766.1 hypothetical protein WS92_07480 [Burkholderia sp. MSMB1588]